jgi:hypothetical protein
MATKDELRGAAAPLRVTDADLCVSRNGKRAKIVLSTEKGPIELDMLRADLERLVFRSVRELAKTIP